MQAAALEMMMVKEERVKARDFVDRFKLSLISHDPVWIKDMFPDWATPEQDDEEVQVEYTDDLIDGPAEYHFDGKVTPEEAEKILAEMASKPTSFGLDEMDEEGWV